uniref:AIG1-type G domain-containing protein n=2 Tax=Dicentrarchus labrax TaxID=13489 RepID=A0A8P4G0K5_DICLA
METERDDIVRQRLFDLFNSDDGVHEISAVGLVLKATENRLSDRLIDSVTSLFGKDMGKNIVALITHSDGRKPKNVLKALKDANMKCAKDETNQPVHFLFDNCQSEDRTEDTNILKHAYRITTENMRQFAAFRAKTELKTLETTVVVINERLKLTTCIQKLQERIDSIEVKQKEIQHTEEMLQKHQQDMRSNKNFAEEVDQVYKAAEPIDGERSWWGCGLLYKEAVSCPVCEMTCQSPRYKMTQSPQRSTVSTDVCCTVCPKQCPVSKHMYDRTYVEKTRKVEMIDEDMRQKYIKSNKDCEIMTSNLGELQKEMEELQEDKDELLEESFQHVVKLEQIALNVDSLSTLVHLDFLIEKMNEKRDTEKVQKLEEMKRRVHTGTRANYQLTAAGSQMKNKYTLKQYDIISKSNLIQSGSPRRYQLPTKKEYIGTVRRTTLGERNVNKKNKTILLVGETEEGKSTLINALVNYTLGVDWKDDVWFEIVEDEQRSQESDVIVYQIFGFEGETLPYSLTVIDTPGYWSTTGTERDDIVRQRLFDLFNADDGVQEINAVGLVLKATENRLSDRLMYVFDSVTSLFGKDVEKNVVAFITHSDGRTPENALKALKEANIKNITNQPVHFLLNNCQSEDRTENTVPLKFAVKIKKEMREFKAFLEITAPLKRETVIREEQSRLTGLIQDLQKRIEEIEHEQGKILLNDNNKKRGWRATYCKNCKKTCHYPCKVSSDLGKCEVMKDGCCTQCGCAVSDHMKEEARQTSRDGESESQLKELQKEKDQLLEESFQLVVRLDQISLKVNSMSTYVYLDFLIEKMEEKKDDEKVNRLKKMKSLVDQKTKDGLQIMLDKLKTAVKQ